MTRGGALPVRPRWTDAVLLLAFAALAAWAALAPRPSPAEVAVVLQLQRLTEADRVLRAVSWFGDGPIDVVAPILGIAVLAAIGWRREAGFAGASVIGSWLLDHGVRLIVARPRPGAPIHVAELTTGWSFPSGHVMQYVALFGFAWIVLRARVPPSAPRRLAEVSLGALLILVGPSRVYLGAHWPSDVLGAYALSLWWLAIVARGYSAAREREPISAGCRRPA